ncbi:MAG: diguanylate cyclase [Oscillospiraceae bacterium]|nr:diguanylate cyclase [Oscillospiraceae bacterium]
MKKNLLVISDSRNFHLIIEAVFRGRHAVFFAETEEDAFSLLEQYPLNLIILTPNMKKADSFRFLEHLRGKDSRYSQIPALMAGAFITPEIISNAHKNNISDIVKLPFEPIEFDIKVEELLIKFSPSRERPDPVTGLPKRYVGQERISKLLSDGKKGALMLVDLDYYSFLSTSVSDNTMIACRDVIQEEVRKDDGNAVLSVVKGGGFLLFVRDLREREKVQDYANRLIGKILEKVNETVFVSIGLAVSERHGKNYEDLYKACDKGLGEARNHGKNIAKFYTW